MGAGANVWVQDGSIWLYLAHNGAYDELGRLLKLGCVRITPADTALGGDGFVQQLDPATGTITIAQNDFKATLWFAGETLVYQSVTGDAKAMEVSFATWRDVDKDGLKLDMLPTPTVKRDQVAADGSGFVWFHRNADHGVNVIETGKSRGIEESAIRDFTTKRVFGGAVAVAGGLNAVTEAPVQWQAWEGKAWTGKSQSKTAHTITMRLAGALDAEPENWKSEAAAALNPEFIQKAKTEELKLWEEFWSRSHIVINRQFSINSRAERDGLEQRDSPEGGRPAGRINPQSADPGYLVGQNHQLFRYMLACNRGGELPLLFNGGIFTTDNPPGRITGNNNDELGISPGTPTTPDHRRWMFCSFMSQNQRWLGWPTLAAGDIDLLMPLVRFYRERASVASSRAKRLGAEGAVYVEPNDIWGFCAAGVAPRPDGLCGAEHLTYHFSMGLEHAWMTLQARDTLGIDITKDLPWIEAVVVFYDSFYRQQTQQRSGKELGPDGKLLIYPGNAVEYASGATNPVEVVAGLTRVTESLLKLPQLPTSSRQRVARIQSTLPELPTALRMGRRSVLPARSFEKEYNPWEPIEMFSAFPYRLVGIVKPGTLQLARDTWDTIPEHRARFSTKFDYSWMPNVINVAALAAPEKAKERAIWKLANTAAPQARFPAFFGPGHDWLPDHNWGGTGMTGLQEMLLAPEPGTTGKLNLFPAWPADWDVDFKLHAPGKTLVEGVLKSGKLVSLKVTPKSREKDIVNWLGKHPEWKPLVPRIPLSQGKPITASSQFAQQGFDASKANDGDPKTRWVSAFDARSGWLEIDLGEEKEIGSILVSEVEWKETRKFTIEVKQGDSWKQVADGTTIGQDKEFLIKPVKARFVRLNVSESALAININEFQVFALADDAR
jgi:hypothetical protein